MESIFPDCIWNLNDNEYSQLYDIVTSTVPTLFNDIINKDELYKLNNLQLYWAYFELISQSDGACTDEEEEVANKKLDICEEVLIDKGLTPDRHYPVII